MEKITFNDINGKVILVGLTYYSRDNAFIEQKQIWGTVIESNENKILVEQKSGEIFSLSPDLRSIQAAAPGEYRLHSTGEIVVDPDFLAAWDIILSGRRYNSR